MCCLKEIHFRTEDTQRLKVSKWKKIFHANENDRNAYIKVDFQTTSITKNGNRYFIMNRAKYRKKIQYFLTHMHLI